VRVAFLRERFRRGGSRVRNTRWKTKTLLHGVEIPSALLVWISLGCLHAEQVDRTIGQFMHTSWSAKDGAPRRCLCSRADDGRISVARDDAGPPSRALDTLFGRWRSAFSSLLSAPVLSRLRRIGPLHNSRIQRGGRKTERRVLLQRWHKPRMGIFGWEVPTACIDSTV